MDVSAPAVSPQQPLTPPPSGPGKALAQARTDLGLSREDVARQLHLKTPLIVSLENDNYESLPGMTYVRGYLRSYAQLLGLAAEPILDAHSRMIGGPQPAVLPSLSPPPQATSGHRHIKLVSYLVASVVVGLAMLWWQGNNNLPTLEFARLGKNPAPQTNEPIGPPDSAQILPPAPLTNADHAYMHTPTPLPESAIAPPPNPAPAAAPSRAQLSLYVEQESWVEVRDGQQNRLVYESLPPGRTMMLEGMVPLYVFLGNANGVRVEFDGKPFDLTPHKRGQVARFALGQGVVTTTAPAPAQGAVR